MLRARPRVAATREVFDIDWEAPGLDGKLLLPVLGEPLAEVVEDGELRRLRSRRPVLRYYDRAAARALHG